MLCTSISCALTALTALTALETFARFNAGGLPLNRYLIVIEKAYDL